MVNTAIESMDLARGAVAIPPVAQVFAFTGELLVMIKVPTSSPPQRIPGSYLFRSQ